MKRILAVLVALALFVTLSACGKETTSSDSSSQTSTTETTNQELFVKPENYASVVTVTINPTFNLYLDASNKVLAVEPVNADSKEIIDKIDITSGNLDTVVKNIVTATNNGGFVKQNAEISFEITVIKDKSIDANAILTKAKETAQNSFKELNIKAEVKTSVSENAESSSDKITNSSQAQSSATESTTSTNNKTEDKKPTTSTTSTKNEPTHTHSFSNATCTEPQKCSCGATQGAALGHNFKDGVCTSCDSEDPNYEPSYTSINNKNGVWCAMIVQGTEIYETTFSLFDEMYISQPIWDEFSTIPEEMRQEIRDDVYNNSFYKVYNGKEYYCGRGSGWDVAEPIISGNTIILNIVEKYAPSNAPSAKIVLNRIDENTIIVESVTENYSKGIDILVDIKFVFSAKQ